MKLKYTQNIISAGDCSLNFIDHPRKPSDRVTEKPLHHSMSGLFCISNPPKNTNNLLINTSGLESCHHGCVGAGMERVFHADGCWMPTEPPNDRNQSTPPDHGIDREASGSTECLTQHSNEQGKNLVMDLLYWLA
jgi:hypothetical protein